MKTRTVITTFVFLTLLSGGLLPPITRLSAADTTNTTKKAPSEGVGLTNEPSIKAERKVKTPSTAEFMRLITDSGFEISQWGATYNVPSLGLLASDVDCTHKSSHLKLSLYCDLNNTNRYKLIAKNNEAEVKALKEIAAKLSAQLPPAIDEIIGRIKQGVKKDTIELGGMAVATLDGNNIMLQTNPEP